MSLNCKWKQPQYSVIDQPCMLRVDTLMGPIKVSIILREVYIVVIFLPQVIFIILCFNFLY